MSPQNLILQRFSLVVIVLALVLLIVSSLLLSQVNPWSTECGGIRSVKPQLSLHEFALLKKKTKTSDYFSDYFSDLFADNCPCDGMTAKVQLLGGIPALFAMFLSLYEFHVGIRGLLASINKYPPHTGCLAGALTISSVLVALASSGCLAYVGAVSHTLCGELSLVRCPEL